MSPKTDNPSHKNIDVNIGRISDFVEDHLSRSSVAHGEVPPLSSLEFSIHGSCNRRCVFCPRVDREAYPNIKKGFSVEVYERIINELTDLNWSGRISYSGFSEPFLHENLLHLVNYTKKTNANITLEIVSNGDYLKLEMLRNLFDAGLDNLRVSLYTPDDTVDRFIKMKDQVGLDDEQFIVRARNKGIEDDYGLTLSNRAGTVDFEKVDRQPIKEPFKRGCNYPMYKMMIDYNGDALICSNDWAKKRIIGNVYNTPVMDLWNSKLMNDARKRLLNSDRCFQPCDKCDVDGLMNGQGHANLWKNFYQQANNS
jgi:radical SAM protein with 4Fe4S-binding SPASM domain